jgi:hypothetical protein
MERFCVVIAWPRQGPEMSAGIQPKCNQMDLAPEELLRLVELIFVCQIPGWTFLLGYILAKR